MHHTREHSFRIWLHIIIAFVTISTADLNWKSDEGRRFDWASDCDFPGTNIIDINSNTNNECGVKCYENPECTHFFWTGGNTCHLRHFKEEQTASDLNKVECGWMSSRGSQPKITGLSDLEWNNDTIEGIKLSKLCLFFGPDDSLLKTTSNQPSDCRAACAALPNCTNFSWFTGSCELNQFKSEVPAHNFKGSTCGFVTHRSVTPRSITDNQPKCNRGINISSGDICETIAAKCDISESELFRHNGFLVGGINCHTPAGVDIGKFVCCVDWVGGAPSDANICVSRPPPGVTVGGISYFPTGDVNWENYPVGSRVEYHCRPPNIRPNIENGNDQPEIGLRTCRSVDGSGWILAWNIAVLCNRDGQWEQSITEQVTKRSPNNSSIIFTTEPPLMDPGQDINTGYWNTVYAVIGVAVILVSFLSGLILRMYHLHKKRDRLIRIARERLLCSAGDPDRINPDISVEEQVDLLPYDLKWEFPRNRIILGKQLGAGQFGVVCQAKQIGTLNNPRDINPRTVAVKMTKSTLSPSALECLASELKIMIHLGPHLNVVNLLGACTMGIVNGELLVIEEFCPYGNIHDYLIANRVYFMDELMKAGENSSAVACRLENEIDFDQIQDEDQEDNIERYTVSSQSVENLLTTSPSSIANPYSKITPVTNFKIPNNVSAIFTESDQDKSNQVVLLNDCGYLMPNLEDNTIEGEEMIKLGIRIRTRDLIYWSFQITSGMNHLANKKVIHGDLAARNVLLAGGSIVKIADFGLSRQTKYNDGTYLKKGNEALPVKWMAIESLTDRNFTTKSDVWSFGVLLWELFSLGKMPYPGITNLNDLIDFLQRGERLKKPNFMPDFVSAIMVQCWENEPNIRPTFSNLEAELGKMLGEELQSHYLTRKNSFTC